MKTAINLDLDFVGIASGDHAQMLNEAGARHIVGNYRNLHGFFEFLNLAERPRK